LWAHVINILYPTRNCYKVVYRNNFRVPNSILLYIWCGAEGNKKEKKFKKSASGHHDELHAPFLVILVEIKCCLDSNETRKEPLLP